ncbi:vWA domain-containing protein [Loktanella agnita]|uniref:vWA domain-containing protein n=1 Tax=Loktanella agnita TaxID=287097 RepID=UPI003987C4E8
MTDDLDDLKAMMTSATPRPDAARRVENLALAQKNFNDLQGSREPTRPTPANGPNGLWTGVWTMLKKLTPKAALTTTTAVIAVGFLAMTPQMQDLLRPPSHDDLQKISGSPVPTREAEDDFSTLLRNPHVPAQDATPPAPQIKTGEPAAAPEIVTRPETRSMVAPEPVAPVEKEQLSDNLAPSLSEESSAPTDALRNAQPVPPLPPASPTPTAPAAREGTVMHVAPSTPDASAQSGDSEAAQIAPDQQSNDQSFRLDADNNVEMSESLSIGRTANSNSEAGWVSSQDDMEDAQSLSLDGLGAPLDLSNGDLFSGDRRFNAESNWLSAGDIEADGFSQQAPSVRRAEIAGDREEVLRGEPTVSAVEQPLRAVAPEANPAPTPNTEAYPISVPRDLKITAEEPVSTFSIDVDTTSYGVVRSSLTRGQLPPRHAIRIEEMINYFPYDYPAPNAGEAPFRPTISTFQTPWNPDTQLVNIALQGQMPAVEDRPPLNLTFLIDTSGSMNQPEKLPLLIQSFRLMLGELRPQDQVAIVTYAGSAGLALAPTPAGERDTMLNALNNLRAGGGTNGQGGLQQAYAVAADMAEEGEVSRIILATDGDFNIGISNPDALKDFIGDQRDSGTYLSVLGFGRGNLDDATMQALAQNGNGTAAYIDTLSEAQKVLVDQLSGALFPIAGDVKVQVEFNPAQVAEYRLIGYETQALNREDFNNDKVDAGELGAGHAVTALYEITPVGSPAQLTDPLRYQPSTVAESSPEIGYVKLRYKAPGESSSQLIETSISRDDVPGTEANFAAAIAGFGQLLRNDSDLGDWGYDSAIALANDNRGEDPFGYRSEAVQLMRLAQNLSR